MNKTVSILHINYSTIWILFIYLFMENMESSAEVICGKI